MNILSRKYIDFVPALLVKGAEDQNSICVFTHKYNKRLYKKKKWYTGAIIYHKKTKDWCFRSGGDFVYGHEYLMIVSRFVYEMNSGRIKFNAEKGELIV